VNVSEERTAYFARLVAFDPEIALEVLEVGDFYITGDQVDEMGGKCFWGGTIFSREAVPVRSEGRRVPLCG